MVKTIKRIVGLGLLMLSALLAVAYVVDYFSVRYRIPGTRAQFGQVTVNTLYVIHVKGGKIQYEPGQQEVDTCVHSLFPHMGYNPCWYVVRHTDKLIDI
jgi:hypothetical protein